MVPKGSLLVGMLIVLVFLVPAAAGQDQTRIAETRLEITANSFLSVGNTLARDDSTSGFVEWQFCHGPGGVNPQDAEMSVTLEFAGAPQWLTITISEELTQSFELPAVSTNSQNEACPPNTNGRWEIFAESSRTAPYGERAEMTATLTVAESGTSHTYQIPEGGSVVMSVEMGPDPGDDITTQLENATNNPGGGGGSGGGGAGGGGGGDSEESPSLPVMAIILGVVLVAALARRR